MRNYFDDDSFSEDDQDDNEDIFYHNYSVEYANQLLNGNHWISSSKHFHRRFDQNRSERILKRSPRLMKISTWDQMIINKDNSSLSQTISQPKFSSNIQQQRTLPSLEDIDQELTRRTQRLNQEKRSTTNQENNTNDHFLSPLNEEQLRQVHQQQQLFQQHLINMQRHLNEQQQQQQRSEIDDQQRENPRSDERSPMNISSSTNSKRNLRRNFDFDDDQQEIVQLIETDPYFAAAMEDFVRSHHLLDQRSTSPSSSISTTSTSTSTTSTTTTSTSSSKSDERNESSRLLNSNDQLLLNEIRGIRNLMKKYFHSKKTDRHSTSIDPSSERPPYPFDQRRKREESRPQSIQYQNLVETMTQIIQRRSPSHQDQPLKPSQINPNYKAKFRKIDRPVPRPPPPPPPPPPPIPTVVPLSSTSTSKSNGINNSPIESRRSSTTNVDLPIRSIPRAPPLPPSLNSSYENTNIRSNERISSNSRQLSYGNQRTSINVYDRFVR